MKNIKDAVHQALALALSAHPALAAAIRPGTDGGVQDTDMVTVYGRFLFIRPADGHDVILADVPGPDILFTQLGTAHGNAVHLDHTGEALLTALNLTPEDILREHLRSRAAEMTLYYSIHGSTVAGVSHVSETRLEDLAIAFLVDPQGGDAWEDVPLYGMTLRLEGDQDVLYSGDATDGVILAVRPDAPAPYSDIRDAPYTPAGAALIQEIQANFRTRHPHAG